MKVKLETDQKEQHRYTEFREQFDVLHRSCETETEGIREDANENEAHDQRLAEGEVQKAHSRG